MLEIMPYEIGKFYRVPCVRARIYETVDIWPVFGPWHEDSGIIGFDQFHFHLDPRFLTDRQIGRLPRGVFAVAVHDHEPTKFLTFSYPGQKVERLGDKRRLCRRRMPNYPHRAAEWLSRLESAYREEKLGPQLICPHRGAPLQGLTPDADGNITCPLHGLCWSLKTGKLTTHGATK